MIAALYNEIDPFAANWTRALIGEGHIAQGVVDERSIEDLTPADVAGPGQRHFFAGIGGWSYALRLAGIADDADVWTGSCPCQPFSQAGKRGGTSDARHLWPAWFALIQECRPPTIFGEQVASADGLGWLDAVFADLERCGYAVGAADLCAAKLAPHGRSRLFFVAYANNSWIRQRLHVSQRELQREVFDVDGRCEDGGVADTVRARRSQRRPITGDRPTARSCATGELGDADGVSGGRNTRAVSRAKAPDPSVRSRALRSGVASANLDPWRSGVWIDCTDGKRRLIPTEPALFPVAHGVPNRVGLLRGGGNAIVPQCAAAFIIAAEEAREEQD